MVRSFHDWATLPYPIIINAFGFSTVAAAVTARFVLA
jgi:hypothetical protein